MSKRKLDEYSNSSKKKSCSQFKKEWLSEIIETVVPTSNNKQKVKICDVFLHKFNSDGSDEIVCKFCFEAKAVSEFSTGKSWYEWKLDYLKRHLIQKAHLDSVAKIRNKNNGGVLQMLNETQTDRETRLELTERKKADANNIKILINNVILAIKINASMLSVQHIHEHVGKYVTIPESWRSKNYAFQFLDCINHVIHTELMDELRKSSFHTLIVDESTDISVQKILILYFKFRSKSELFCKTIFAGIVKLNKCDSESIVNAIKTFYSNNELDLQKMIMFTSDGAAVMLGKKNGVASVLRHSITHLSEQHCVAHREDLGIDDAWKKVAIMSDIETLLRTIYTMFSRSSVKKGQFEQLAEVSEHDAVAFRPLNEVRWLSRHFAVSALIRNYDILIEYCKEQVENLNDPINKYCLKMLTNPRIKLILTVLNDILSELASLSKYFQKTSLTTIEALQFAKAKIKKFRSQYLEGDVYWSNEVNNVLLGTPNLNDKDNTKEILEFIKLLCNHLDDRFPEEELIEGIAFDPDTISKTNDFQFGKDSILKLIEKYSVFMPNYEECIYTKISNQYSDFKFIVAEKVKTGTIKTFTDVAEFALKNTEYQDLSILIDIFATFQASSADCERGFSLMNTIKTKARNRLEAEHLGNIMRIKFYISLGRDIDLDTVHKYWTTKKDRREKLQINE